MILSDFRAEARKQLSGKWGKAVCITLAYFAIVFLIGIIQGVIPESMEVLVSIIVLIIDIPLSFGYIISFVKLYNQEEVNTFDFLTNGFSNFTKAWSIYFRIIIKIIVPLILLILSYVLIYFRSFLAIE